MRLCLAYLLVLSAPSYAQQYQLQSSFSGLNFFENFDFWTSGDPTFGYVHYVDQPTAEQYGMIKITNESATWGVDTTMTLDPFANLGRLSVRLTSVQSWTHGLFILDLAHMPANQCGVWPAWWMLGSGTWPENGEMDLIEFANNLPNGVMALHTSESPNCTVAEAGQSGTLLTANCAGGGGYTGCGVANNLPSNIGTSFNRASGGVYAMEWTLTAICMWFFTRDEVPASILSADETGPDPSTFGDPVANFQGSCDIDAHFFNHSMVFDTTFCGSYAGNTWRGDGCPMLDSTNGWQSCNDFVALNPEAFVEAYWEVNYLKVYQTAAGAQVTSSSSLSSVTPAIRTSSISSALSAAQGRSTTPSGTPSLVITTPTSTPASVISSLLGSDTAVVPTSSALAEPSAAVPTPSTLSESSTAASTSVALAESSSAAPIYVTTVVVVITVEPEQAPTFAPRLELWQAVEGTTTDWPEPYPTAYCEANPAACDDLVEYRADYGDRRHGMPLPAPLPIEGSISPRGLPESTSTTTTGPPLIKPALRPNGIDVVPVEDEAAPPQLYAPSRYIGKGIDSKKILPGGSLNYCGVPGSACIEHREQEADVSPHIRAPSIAFSEKVLMTPKPTLPKLPKPTPKPKPKPSHKTTHTPRVPYVGPNGIVHMPPRERDAQKMKGGSLNYCGVPGSACRGHWRADKDESGLPQGSEANINVVPSTTTTQETPDVPATSTPTLATTTVESLTLEVKPPRIPSSWLYLLGPALETTYWISGTRYHPPAYKPTFFHFDPQSKRTAEAIEPTPVPDVTRTLDAEHTDAVHAMITPSPAVNTVEELTIEVKGAMTAASMDYLLGPALETTYWIDGIKYVPPPYTPTMFNFDPAWKRTAEVIKPTPPSDESATSTRSHGAEHVSSRAVEVAEKNVWARQRPALDEALSWTPTTFSYAPVIKRADVMQRSARAELYPQEGSVQPSVTESAHISSATCTPVVVVDQSGLPSGTGCMAPENVEITKSEPIIVADMTITVTLPPVDTPMITGTAGKYSALVDATNDSMAASAAPKQLSAMAMAGSCLVVFVLLVAVL